ncbi:ABC transporter ATP-binding protein [Leptospira jelokensis]|uniref:ABC transporter ATP-binding protein n=1 Tax=Leptospira jelokensis TaxID=2484931 RepID=UPI001090C86C|nr:ATP-binding cassette domain-containing protein [Leptospira jelokensis]TGL99309.1 ATP-binding cassette domain-containing protein [Leptospira jelokensis]
MFTIKNLSVSIGQRNLINQISLQANTNEITGLVGRSGSGKSTLFRLALGLLTTEAGYKWEGDMDWKGIPLGKKPTPILQPVFQDPFGSFSPFGSIGELLLEPIRIQKKFTLSSKEKKEEWDKVETICHSFGLKKELLDKTKNELSGGQLQRFAIVRAMLANPEYLLLDEPVTALDVLVQKKIAEELKERNRTHQLGMFIVSHDIGFLSFMCDQLFVLEGGQITESGNPKEIFKNPKSNLMQELIRARSHSFGGDTSSSESSN